MSVRLVSGTERIRYVGALVAVAAVYYLAGRVGLELAYLDGAVAAPWPPAGLGLAVLVLYGVRLWRCALSWPPERTSGEPPSTITRRRCT